MAADESTALDIPFTAPETPSLTDLKNRLVADIGSYVDKPSNHPDALLSEEPLIRFVNRMILDAAERHASDIHIEPFQDTCRIRCRQHGVLQITAELPSTLAGRLTTRLKVMASMDIAERRLPQDGRFQLDELDIRISTCPVLYGEKCVLRLLRMQNTLPELAHTGMSLDDQRLFCDTLAQPQGLILITGPTGSGKTVTLYAALNHLNQPAKNIATVEDPVEIHFPGINQISINPRTGLQFATALRALLRQDPDIIMVGEIRDPETAAMAVQAAQTGHLVLTTLHTHSASEALRRLAGMGVDESLIHASMRLVIAQRLLRVLCKECRQPVCPDKSHFPEIVHAGQHILYEAGGCAACAGGYTGRTAIFEFLPHWPGSIPAVAKQSLRQAGVRKVFAGETSVSELGRVLESRGER